MIKAFKIIAAFSLLVFLAAPSFAAWQVISGPETACTTCGNLEAGKSATAFRVKLISDGTTLTEAENVTVNFGGIQGKYLYDVTVVNPASGGPSAAWNLEIQDTETGKKVITEDDVTETASLVIPITGADGTGKVELILGGLRIVVSDDSMLTTEYVYLVFTLIE
jgi:hypothetical protein